MPPTVEYTTPQRKELVLEALKKNLGLVYKSCESANITPCVFYKWKKTDPEFKAAVENIIEFTLDEVEKVAHTMIVEEHNPAMTIFYLKCKGKHRGYIEKQEIEHSGNPDNMKQMLELINKYERQY